MRSRYEAHREQAEALATVLRQSGHDVSTLDLLDAMAVLAQTLKPDHRAAEHYQQAIRESS